MIPSRFQGRLRLPMIAAPMFLVSNPDLVVASCKAGIVGTLPSLNQRTAAGFDDWLKEIRERLGDDAVPYGVQFPVHKTNTRLAEDLATTIRHKVPLLITSLGITREVTDAIHAYGGLVFHDAISVRHARKALEANVDGIIAVCGGAGGHAGTYNPFAFLGELKPLMGPNRTLLVGGCIGDGYSMAGAIAAGADMVYVGTRMLATKESGAMDANKRLVVESDITDVVYSDQVDGVGGNWLKSTIPPPTAALGKDDVDTSSMLSDLKRWRDIWSAGQGVGSIKDTPTTAELIARMEGEFVAATHRLRGVESARAPAEATA
ncbi:MAG: nitronate monooxygenase [Burkholderiales bacterium]|nr:nitronate monooxygenase [Burkholderiales bacterium]